MNASEGFSVEFSKDGIVQDIDISAAVTREFSKDEVTQCQKSSSFQEYLFGREKVFLSKLILDLHSGVGIDFFYHFYDIFVFFRVLRHDS